MAIIKINIDMVYPIGSIYMSTINNSPSKWIGGTWERIQDRFLFGAIDGDDTYSAGKEGGEHQHTLLMAEMPKHSHAVFVAADNGWTGTAKSAVEQSTTNKQTSTAGQDKPHNNMPPYLTVYMWKRIA